MLTLILLWAAALLAAVFGVITTINLRKVRIVDCRQELALLREEVEGVRRALDRLNDTIHEDLLKDEVFLGEINQDNARSF